jgi:carboxylesterase type B
MEIEAVRIEGYHEVLALHRMLMEYKFEDLASVYAGSPFIAAIQNRLADALRAVDPVWREWLRAETHPHRVESIRIHLAEVGAWWQDSDREQRAKYVLDLLAPLQPSDELVADLTAIKGAATSSSDSNGA